VSPALRRALQRRDLGCRFPGCNCTRFVDAHHIHHWADGGETNLANLVLLCRAHHRLLHEGGFRLIKSAGNRFQFINPQGVVIPDVPKKRFCGNVLELEAGNKQTGLQIDHKTAIPNWGGEGMDLDIVVHGLLLRQDQ
ncbi:MAG TPA: HNH endonuclease signature motif containing protein, partial [Xanthomonadales bacterium]|nr:HNH endonuclease signature motif containing protein [Xanthomonadales bacterium]